MTSIPAAHPIAAERPQAPVHEPYIPASQAPAELTPRAITLGVLLGLIFGASNVYLALKIGLTVSASIPIAEDQPDRKSTRLNSSHVEISYAVFCLKKKKKKKKIINTKLKMSK